MNLASVHSDHENTWVRRLCEADCWLGLSDAANETGFEWTDGTPYDYWRWAPGEPNGQSGDVADYAYMYIDTYPGFAGRWDDRWVDLAPPLRPWAAAQSEGVGRR